MALLLKGNNYIQGTSVSIPSHNAGDLLLLIGMTTSYGVAPIAPAASGTIPSFTKVLSTSGGGPSSQLSIYYTLATANNHTSGTWTNMYSTDWLVALVFSGHKPTGPIGGFSSASSQAAYSMPVPAVTMTNTDGSSKLYHMYVLQNGGGYSWSLSATPAGYTNLYNLASPNSYAWRLFSKDDTTSDGSVPLTTGLSSWNTGGGYSVASIEIVAAPTSGFFNMF